MLDVRSRRLLLSEPIEAASDGEPGEPDAPAPRVVVLGDGEVIYLDQGGEHAVDVSTGNSFSGDDRGLLALAGGPQGVRLMQAEPGSLEIRGSTNGTVTVPGTGGQLSADGAFVLTRVGVPSGEGAGTGRAVPGNRLRLYQTSTGAEAPTGVAKDDVVLSVAFGAPGKVLYALARQADLPQAGDYVRSSFSGPIRIVTCLLGSTRCALDTTVSGSGEPPVFAGAP